MESFITSSKRVLEPIERVSEVLFGLIMVLTFTGSFAAAEGGEAGVREMLIAALGCNTAWGVIDGAFYLMGCLAERGRNLSALHGARTASDPRQAHGLIAGALPPLIASVLEPGELDAIRARLKALPEPPSRARLSGRDWLGAVSVFLLVFLSTFPVAIPFLLVDDSARALRASNAVAIVLLFLTGYAFGHASGRNAWLMGLLMVLLGAAMVALTIALGG